MDRLESVIPGRTPDGSSILSVLGRLIFRFANGQNAWIDEEGIGFIEGNR